MRLHGLDVTIKEWIKALGFERLDRQFDSCLRYAKEHGYSGLTGSEHKFYSGQDQDGKTLRSVYVGQLSTKLEAAGKIRVFAMVDV